MKNPAAIALALVLAGCAGAVAPSELDAAPCAAPDAVESGAAAGDASGPGDADMTDAAETGQDDGGGCRHAVFCKPAETFDDVICRCVRQDAGDGG